MSRINKRWTEKMIAVGLKKIANGELTCTDPDYYRVRSVARYHYGDTDKAYKAARVENKLKRRKWQDALLAYKPKPAPRLKQFCLVLVQAIESGRQGIRVVEDCMAYIREGHGDDLVVNTFYKE